MILIPCKTTSSMRKTPWSSTKEKYSIYGQWKKMVTIWSYNLSKPKRNIQEKIKTPQGNPWHSFSPKKKKTTHSSSLEKKTNKGSFLSSLHCQFFLSTLFYLSRYFLFSFLNSNHQPLYPFSYGYLKPSNEGLEHGY